MVEELKVTNSNTRDEDQGEDNILLVIDQPDILLAATGPAMGIGATEMGEWVMGLREVCSARPLPWTFDPGPSANAGKGQHR